MTSKKLGGGMYYKIRAMLDRPDQIRRPEGIVNHKRQAMPMRDRRDRDGGQRRAEQDAAAVEER